MFHHHHLIRFQHTVLYKFAIELTWINIFGFG